MSASTEDVFVSLDPATGERVSGPFDLGAQVPISVSSPPDDSRLLVTTWRDGVFTTRMLDADDGTVISPELEGPEITTLAGDAVVGAEGTRLLTYAIDDFAVTGSLPNTTATTTSLQASADGRTLLATGIDGSASLFDLASGMRLGEPDPVRRRERIRGLPARRRPVSSPWSSRTACSFGTSIPSPDPRRHAGSRAATSLARSGTPTSVTIAPYRSTCGFGSPGG